ncbi:MAG: hypothetical protein ACXWCM_01310 [Acidimicrobiales bacterium]
MGFFKDVHSLSKTSKEMGKTSDPGARMSEMTSKMAGMNQMLAQSNAALAAPPLDGVEASAQVVSVGMASGSMNGDPIVPVELLVLQPGMPPRPVSTSVIVPVVQLPRLQAGATLPVRISRADPSALAIDWLTAV